MREPIKDLDRLEHILNAIDVLLNGYYQILPHQLWDTVDTDIEPLRPIIQELYNQEKGK